jgi:hypothetical protein
VILFTVVLFMARRGRRLAGMTGREASHGLAHTAAIRDTAVDYMQSWLDGDPDRMRRCLHPDLAKRRCRDSASGDLALWGQCAIPASRELTA